MLKSLVEITATARKDYFYFNRSCFIFSNDNLIFIRYRFHFCPPLETWAEEAVTFFPFSPKNVTCCRNSYKLRSFRDFLLPGRIFLGCEGNSPCTPFLQCSRKLLYLATFLRFMCLEKEA